ncbi:hypothetical protein [Methylobacter marinus]|nr:hypothetical protein [Methylobacter marinus]
MPNGSSLSSGTTMAPSMTTVHGVDLAQFVDGAPAQQGRFRLE